MLERSALRRFALITLLLLQACGGGGGGDSGSNGSGDVNTSVTIAKLDVVQTYSQQSSTGYQRLVPGKQALVRVFLTGTTGAVSPALSAQVSANGTALGTLTLSGPATISNTVDSFSYGQSYNATMPPEWVRSGLQVVVEARNGSELVAKATRTPVVGSRVTMQLMLVPLIADNGNSGATVTAQLPAPTDIRNTLLRTYPLVADALTTSVRAAYRITSTAAVRSEDEWVDALQELEQLRSSENAANNRGNGWHYFGFVPLPNFSSGIVGLAYQNTSNGNGAVRSAIGADNEVPFALDTMTHELGHNQGLGHAPCGLSAQEIQADDFARTFPYTNGGVGPAPIFDALSLTPATPKPVYDVMSYCDGAYFSDYSYQKVQAFMENLTSASLRNVAVAAPIDLLLLTGRISGDTVSFKPATALRGRPSSGSGDWTLRVQTTDGATSDYPFTPVQVADATGAPAHFAIAVPAGDIAQVQVLHQGKTLPSTAPDAAVSASARGATGSSDLQWSEAAGQLELVWDAARYPSLAVSHVDAETQVLALNLTGGKASLPLAGLPAGGKWVFSLARGFSAKRIEAAR
ncbi:hypothetical protein [Niveibacterium sp. SC-1]|uniref:M12 family metallo-peptidase n=1 Tax=Niveibacterium sp. SC-1 TaxID=3135646 RepID=UPI00311F7C93